jgi:hypothetical protein
VYVTWSYGSETISTPSTWTIFPNLPALTGIGLVAYYKILGTGETAPTVNWSGAGNGGAIVLQLNGDVDTSVTIEASASRVTTGTNGVGFPALTISTANCYVLGLGVRRKSGTGDGETFSTMGSFTKLVSSVPAGNFQSAFCLNRWQQTTATSISLTSQGTSISDSSLAEASYLVAIRTAAAASSGFTAGPTLNSKTSNSYTWGATPSASGTWYIVATLADSATPTPTQIKAAQNGTGGAAEAAVNKAVTAADTQVLGGALANPLYDVHHVLHTTVDSAVASFLAQFLNPAAGKQFTVRNGAPPGGALSIGDGASPAVADTDVFVVDAVTGPDGDTLIVAADGSVSYTGTSNRQSFVAQYYDRSAALLSPAVTNYINNKAPQGPPKPPVFVFPVGVAITPINLSPYGTDPNGDTVIVTTVDALPTGLSITASSLSGTPSVPGIYQVNTNFADLAGDSSNAILTYLVGQITVPNVVGLDVLVATNTLTATYLAAGGATAGTVTVQSPAAGVPVNPFTVITLTIAGAATGSPSGFDGAGNYIRPFSWSADKAAGFGVTAGRMDKEMNQLAAGLSLAVTRDGQGAMTTNFLPGADASFTLGSADS